jgi:hypothetical protein
MPKRRTHPAALPMFPPLTSEQEQAMTLLLDGKTTTEVATVLQCSADDVASWRHEHPIFVARLNQAKRRRWEEAQDRLRALVPEAIATLEKAMQQGSVKAAVELLKIVQLHGQVHPPNGPKDPQLLVWHQAEQWAQMEMQHDGPDDDGKLWDETVRQRLTLTHHKAGELLTQWTTNGSTAGE